MAGGEQEDGKSADGERGWGVSFSFESGLGVILTRQRMFRVLVGEGGGGTEKKGRTCF